MAELKDSGFDPDKIAEALNKAADTWTPSKLTLQDKLSEPRVYEAIKNLKRKGASGKEVVAILADLGIKTTPQSLNGMLAKIERKARGETNEKPRRERKASTAASAAETGKQAASGAAKQADAKPDGNPADSSGDKSGTTEGRKLNKSPSMGGAFDQSNL